MRLTMRSRREVSREYARRYQKLMKMKKKTKKEKGKLLDEFTKLTGYNRCYASYILRNWGKRVILWSGTENEKRLVVIGACTKRKSYEVRCRKYDGPVLEKLKVLWEVLNFPCGKRLKEELSEIVKKSRQFDELKISKEVELKLNQISAATIDRLLKPIRKKYEIKCKGRTKPGSLLKKQIRIRTGVEWDEDRVGYVEIDLVSHDGGNSRGDFCQTLDMVDIKSGWTEMSAVKNRAQIWVFEALTAIRERLPFELRGIDCDNGSEFINAHLFNYCKQEVIDFTRGRASHKNDNCYVEEKNFTAVRNYVGYSRYDNEEERLVLNELYSYLRLYLNFFQPVMKLKSKQRMGAGAKVKKKYDKAKTPFQRLLANNEIDDEKKQNLKNIYHNLNPFDLKRRIEKLQEKLDYMVYLKRKGISVNKHEYLRKESTLQANFM